VRPRAGPCALQLARKPSAGTSVRPLQRKDLPAQFARPALVGTRISCRRLDVRRSSGGGKVRYDASSSRAQVARQIPFGPRSRARNQSRLAQLPLACDDAFALRLLRRASMLLATAERDALRGVHITRRCCRPPSSEASLQCTSARRWPRRRSRPADPHAFDAPLAADSRRSRSSYLVHGRVLASCFRQRGADVEEGRARPPRPQHARESLR
jgi:hypothetical protein